jgi:hypothetical protein
MAFYHRLLVGYHFALDQQLVIASNLTRRAACICTRERFFRNVWLELRAVGFADTCDHDVRENLQGSCCENQKLD